MSICSRCGQSIEFRYIDGRCIPIHTDGGCASGYGYSSGNDFTGYLSSDQSTCFQTNCPNCGENVFFIRHNGGSVWIDPPLGPPWYKHGCMDSQKPSQSGLQSSLALDFDIPIPKNDAPDKLIVGVVTEAETSLFNETTLLNVQTGEKDNFLLLIKNSAGFLVGRIVVFDTDFSTIRWIVNEMYSFKILAPLKHPKAFDFSEDTMITCPECSVHVEAKNLAKHFRKKHFFMML